MAAAAGYSGTPLAKKLGITDDGTYVLVGEVPADADELLAPLPPGASAVGAGESVDVAVLFATQAASIGPTWEPLTERARAIWLAWPKRAAVKAGLATTDITEDRLRELLLPTGWVDTKVCAISEIWSGLRFNRRTT
jgi:hypothetical protein